MLLELYLETLETTNEEWRQYVQQISFPQKKQEERKKYTQVVNDETGILRLISEGKEIIITFKKYGKDSELIL